MAGGKRVLIADDERPLSHALELKLQHEGFETTVVHDGEECLKILEDHDFDIILLDLVMPVVDGFQVLEEMQKKGKKAVVFALSNLSQSEDEERVMAMGVKKYFIKSNTPLGVIVDEVKQV